MLSRKVARKFKRFCFSWKHKEICIIFFNEALQKAWKMRKFQEKMMNFLWKVILHFNITKWRKAVKSNFWHNFRSSLFHDNKSVSMAKFTNQKFINQAQKASFIPQLALFSRDILCQKEYKSYPFFLVLFSIVVIWVVHILKIKNFVSIMENVSFYPILP